MQRTRIAIADDNPEISRILVEVLEPEFSVEGIFFSGSSVLQGLHLYDPDLLILDISLGDLSGFEVAARLAKLNSRTKIIFLTVHENVDFIRAAFDLGAWGYVFKSNLSTDLPKAIRNVGRGKRFVPAMVSGIAI